MAHNELHQLLYVFYYSRLIAISYKAAIERIVNGKTNTNKIGFFIYIFLKC